MAHLAGLLVLIGVALVQPLDAQVPGGRRGPPADRAEMEQRVRAQMARIVQERLDLTAEESDALTEALQGFESRRRQLRRSEMATRRRVEALLLDGVTDQDGARELLDRLVEIRAQESALFAEEQDALLEILTPVQVLELQALRQEMGRRIRALRGDGPDRRRRGPGGGAPGNVDGFPGVPLSR